MGSAPVHCRVNYEDRKRSFLIATADLSKSARQDVHMPPKTGMFGLWGSCFLS